MPGGDCDWYTRLFAVSIERNVPCWHVQQVPEVISKRSSQAIGAGNATLEDEDEDSEEEDRRDFTVDVVAADWTSQSNVIRWFQKLTKTAPFDCHWNVQSSMIFANIS